MSHQIRLEDDVYERIKTNKREGESFSDAVERLIGGRSLRDLRDVFDEDQVSEMRDAIKKLLIKKIEAKSAKSQSDSNDRRHELRFRCYR